MQMSWTWPTTISVVLTFEIESRTLYSKSLNVNYRWHEDTDLEDTIQLGNSEVLRIGGERSGTQENRSTRSISEDLQTEGGI